MLQSLLQMGKKESCAHHFASAVRPEKCAPPVIQQHPPRIKRPHCVWLFKGKIIAWGQRKVAILRQSCKFFGFSYPRGGAYIFFPWTWAGLWPPWSVEHKWSEVAWLPRPCQGPCSISLLVGTVAPETLICPVGNPHTLCSPRWRCRTWCRSSWAQPYNHPFQGTRYTSEAILDPPLAECH